jgi:hypothetical protein
VTDVLWREREEGCMSKAKTHEVEFKAHKTVKRKVKVEFETREGPVAFKAKKPVDKVVKVKFKAHNKK